jgi:hypothetical protein
MILNSGVGLMGVRRRLLELLKEFWGSAVGSAMGEVENCT